MTSLFALSTILFFGIAQSEFMLGANQCKSDLNTSLIKHRPPLETTFCGAPRSPIIAIVRKAFATAAVLFLMGYNERYLEKASIATRMCLFPSLDSHLIKARHVVFSSQIRPQS
jgi:hypothetical protein